MEVRKGKIPARASKSKHGKEVPKKQAQKQPQQQQEEQQEPESPEAPLLDGMGLAHQFLEQHGREQPDMQQKVNPSAKWVFGAWRHVHESCVRFEEEPNGQPHTWADLQSDIKPHTLRVDIWAGDPNGSEVALDKVAEATKSPVKSRTIDELMAICTRISLYGVSVRMKPSSMLNLAISVFRDHPSVKAALSGNAVSDMESLNQLLGRVYSTTTLVDKYLKDVISPKHYDYEDFNIFMQRCIAAFVSVSWYVKLSQVVVGIVKALPLNLWADSAPTLVDGLKAHLEHPNLEGIGELSLAHETQFSGLSEIVWDRQAGRHKAQPVGGNATLHQPRPVEGNREFVRDNSDRGRGRFATNRDKGGKNNRHREGQASTQRQVAVVPPKASSVTCYACQQPGHRVPQCPDASAKAAYEKKRDSDKANLKAAVKPGSERAVRRK